MEEKIHSCKENVYNDVEILYEQINIALWSWVLEQTWQANKSDVTDKLTDHEGEIICSHTVLITFCPFCGANLTKIKKPFSIPSKK